MMLRDTLSVTTSAIATTRKRELLVRTVRAVISGFRSLSKMTSTSRFDRRAKRSVMRGDP